MKLDTDNNNIKKILECFDILIEDFEKLKIEDYVVCGSLAIYLYYKHKDKKINDIDILLENIFFKHLKNLDQNTWEIIIKNPVFCKIKNINLNVTVDIINNSYSIIPSPKFWRTFSYNKKDIKCSLIKYTKYFNL